MVRIPSHRPPTHPGEMLLEEFLNPMGLSQRDVAEGIRVPYQRVNELVNGRRGITPSTAFRLAKFFGTTPDLWMNLQLRWDLYHAQESRGEGPMELVLPGANVSEEVVFVSLGRSVVRTGFRLAGDRVARSTIPGR